MSEPRYYQPPRGQIEWDGKVQHTISIHEEQVVLDWLAQFDPELSNYLIPLDTVIVLDDEARTISFEVGDRDPETKRLNWKILLRADGSIAFRERVIHLESAPPAFPFEHWEIIP